MSHFGAADAAVRQRDSLGLCGEGLGGTPCQRSRPPAGARQGRGTPKGCSLSRQPAERRATTNNAERRNTAEQGGRADVRQLVERGAAMCFVCEPRGSRSSRRKPNRRRGAWADGKSREYRI